MKFICLFSLFLAWPGFSLPATALLGALALFPHAIIGDDDRIEWFEERQHVLKELGRSTVILIDKKQNWLIRNTHDYTLSPKIPTHGEADNLCPTVRFREQPAPGFCSGFYLGDDLVATSAHCFTHTKCRDTLFLFDFRYQREGKLNRRFRFDQVYACQQIVSQSIGQDWAIVRLDRPVRKRRPFQLRRIGQPPKGTPLVVMGYPRGIPLKLAGNAKVVEPHGFADENIFLEADFDAFGGNSGSPVVNAKSGMVEGILVVSFGEFAKEKLSDERECNQLRRYHDPKEATPGWATRATVVGTEEP